MYRHNEKKNGFFQLFFVSLKMDVNFANKQIIYPHIHLHVYVPFPPRFTEDWFNGKSFKPP